MDTKQCTKCGQERELSEFSRDKYAPDGIKRSCRSCDKQQFLDWTANNKIAHTEEFYANRVGGKKCSVCKMILPFEQFNRQRESKDGRDNRCRSCQNEYARTYYEKTKPVKIPLPEGMKRCSTCKEVKDVANFNKNRAMTDGLQNVCKSCEAIYRQQLLAKPEFKRKMSEYRRKYNQIPENKQRNQELKRKRYQCLEVREAAAKRHKAYYQLPGTRTRLLAVYKQYHQEHRDEISARKRAYYNDPDNAENIKERRKRYGRNPRRRAQQVQYALRRRALKLRAPSDLTMEQRQSIVERYSGICVYCGQPHSKLQIDHVIPLTKGGYDTIANALPACSKCNGSKNNKMLDDWMGAEKYKEWLNWMKEQFYKKESL